MGSESTIGPEDVRGRWKQALETYDDARFNANHERWNTAVDRAYYATFYGVLACLALKGERTKTHKGALGLFSKLFIKPEKMAKTLSAKFQRLMENRIEADYTLGSTFDADGVEKIVETSREVLRGIHEYLKDEFDKKLPAPPEK